MPAPIRAQRNISTTEWTLLDMTATLAVFAAGRSHVLEGSDGLQWPGIGFDTMELYRKSTDHADEARQVMRAYP
eukprot:2894737-Pleurochrysis_carterae.AAC.1